MCFSVFRTKNTVSTPNGTLQPNQTLTESDHKTVIDKQWKEGHDYFRVESSIVCHDGESVQVCYNNSLLKFDKQSFCTDTTLPHRYMYCCLS